MLCTSGKRCRKSPRVCQMSAPRTRHTVEARAPAGQASRQRKSKAPEAHTKIQRKKIISPDPRRGLLRLFRPGARASQHVGLHRHRRQKKAACSGSRVSSLLRDAAPTPSHDVGTTLPTEARTVLCDSCRSRRTDGSCDSRKLKTEARAQAKGVPRGSSCHHPKPG